MPDDQGRLFLYFDTNVLLDILDKRREASLLLWEHFKSEDWAAMTSPFTVLEMLDAKQSDRWAEKQQKAGLSFWQIQRRVGDRRKGPHKLNGTELDSVYEELYEGMTEIFELVVFPEMAAGLLTKAEDVCASTNIDPSDSLHLATAIYYSCDILVTSDTTFIPLARPYIISARPEDFFSKALVDYERQTASQSEQDNNEE